MSSWNYADVWEEIAAIQPEQPAIVQGSRTISWGEFEERSRGVADWMLSLGAQYQDKIALYLYNSPEYMEGTFAAFRTGLVPVNTNYRYGNEELLYLWENADALAVIFHGSFAERIESIKDQCTKVKGWLWVDDGAGPCPAWATPYESVTSEVPNSLDFEWSRTADDLLMLYTGGTTGMPKGVMWRQDDLFVLVNGGETGRYDTTKGVDDVTRVVTSQGPGMTLLPVCPLMHGTGMFTALKILSEAGRLVLMEDRHYDPETLARTIGDESVNVIVIVGDPFARPLVDVLNENPDSYSLASLLVIMSSGAMWSEDVKQGLLSHNPNMMLIDAFSSSEALGMGSSVSTGNSAAATAEFKLGPHVRVIDEDGNDIAPGAETPGVLALGGRNPLGYYKDDVKTAATFRVIDGKRYSVPGDFAKVHEDGTIQLLGRGSQCINTAGEKVFPEEVEEILKRHPQILDACVVGIPDPKTGERVVAAIEVESGAAPEADEVITHVKEHLAHYKAPKNVRIVSTIGRSPSGKMDYGRHKTEAIEWMESHK